MVFCRSMKSYELTPDLMFENDIANLAESIRPNVNIIIDYFEDIVKLIIKI